MGRELRCGKYHIRTVFGSLLHDYEIWEGGYRQLFQIIRSSNEEIFIVNEFSLINNIGCFVECYCYEDALRVHKLAKRHSIIDKTESSVFERSVDLKKRVDYEGDQKPWFFSKDPFILEDIFIQ